MVAIDGSEKDEIENRAEAWETSLALGLALLGLRCRT